MGILDKVIHNFKTNKLDYFLLSLILLLAFVLRMINIEKPEGLWFDEIYCWYLSSSKMPVEFLSKIYHEDFHAPLYFFLLHFWMKLFSQTDIYLRMFSVLAGTLAVPIAYLIGREVDYKDAENNFKIGSLTGLVASLFVTVNSLLIYYSQEVKFYSLIFLFSSINLLFLIRFLKNPDKINSFGIIISTLCILYTLTISSLYLAPLALIYATFLYIKNKNSFAKFLKIIAITFICYLPYLPVILHHIGALNTSYIDLSAVFAFSTNNFIALVQYIFSPFISTLNNGVPVFEGLKKYYFLNFQFIVLVFIPIVIGVYGLIRAIIKKTSLNLFLGISLCYVCLVTILAFCGTLGFIPRFLLIALPVVPIASAFGLCSLKNKVLSKILISFFILVNVFYLISAGDSAPKVQRDSTYGILNNMLVENKTTNKDIIVCVFAPKMIAKYGNYEVLDFNFMEVFVKNKNGLLETVLDKDLAEQLNKKNAKALLKNYIFSQKISSKFEEYLYKNIYKQLSPKSKFVIIVSDELYFQPKAMEIIKNDDKLYERIPLISLIYTKINFDIISFAQKYFILDSVKQKDFWIVLTFKSISNRDMNF